MNDELIDSLRIDRRESDSGETSRAPWIVIVIVIVGIALAAGAAWWWSQPGAAEVRAVQPELVEAPGSAAVSSVLDASGYVVARRQATVAAEVTGKLIEVDVEEGMSVEQGQVLARLDDATERAQLELARARLAAASSALDEISALLDNARRTLERQRDLKQRELTSQADVDLAVTEVATLSARLANQRRLVTVAEREVAVARQRLDELTIRAPFSGVVIARAAQAGEMVSPISAGGGFTRTGICTIVDMDSLEIEVDVNEAYIDRVATGQPVVATLDAYPELQIPAQVKAVVPAADRQKATVRVRVAIEQRDPRILPEMGISVRFLEAGDDDAQPTPASSRPLPSIPSDAVFRRDGRDYVYRIGNGRVERVAVQLGASDGDRVLVAAGIGAGDRLVADASGLDLENGDPVDIVEP
jgi:RND family efflux transporter MFP subunit